MRTNHPNDKRLSSNSSPNNANYYKYCNISETETLLQTILHTIKIALSGGNMTSIPRESTPSKDSNT